tara:strand:+ start:99 stop:1316 length:1218 start_codon:yes stop_codon:yes gene_type:complete
MSITNPVVGIHSDGYENNVVSEDHSDPLVPNYGPYYMTNSLKKNEWEAYTNTELSNLYSNNKDKKLRSNPCQISIIKKYYIMSNRVIHSVSESTSNNDSKAVRKHMLKLFGRVIGYGTTDVTAAEENYLNMLHDKDLELETDKLDRQLYDMKNKIGIFRDPIFPECYPWIIPKFTYTAKRSGTFKTPNEIVVNQEFHRAKALINGGLDDEAMFWVFKHYEKFFINDPTVDWGPRDIGFHNLLFDKGTQQILYIDNEGYQRYLFSKKEYFRYKTVSRINPNIGEYLPGKDWNTPYETIRNDVIMNGNVKVFFKRLCFYSKMVNNITINQNPIEPYDQAYDDEQENIIISIQNKIKSGIAPFSNWFYNEGERTMQMTDEYVKPIDGKQRHRPFFTIKVWDAEKYFLR